MVLLGIPVLLLLAMPVHSRQDDPRLDELFLTLQETRDPATARITMSKIWEVWFEAGDELLDQFMSRGRSAMAAGQLAEALANFDQAIAMDPKYAEAWNQRATIYYFMGNLEGSSHDAEQTLALEPRHFGALSGLGLIHIRKGELEQAISWFEQALAVNPHSASSRKNIEWVKQKLQQNIATTHSDPNVLVAPEQV
tara:strand:+ start:2311 stop:2898 length:588 start_codon:yes stop_codon:yes gene_type:complete